MTGAAHGSTSTHLHAVRRALAVAVVGLVATAGAGCGSDGADEVPMSAVAWEDGEPQGPLEEDEWVEAVRAAEVAYAWAAGTADFSSSELAQSWDPNLVSDFVAQVQGLLLHGLPRVYMGPQPLAPVAVEVREDGRSAVVAACVGAPDTRPREDDGNRWPNVNYYEVELGEDGHRRVTGGFWPDEPFLLADGTEFTPEHCDGVTLPRARFDPPPSLESLAAKGRDDVILPSTTPSPMP